ncbi:hypothetical protein HPB49_002556 [Dermacentor silvarum]|uniref:Uncharacterized protein n=1 Tax=Dermacentor silvarum TaxID=543639 RepID=A0ACB8CUM4_DERSI|nr:hypothetical protein HPB49_002556 [Dermacentor silvarum]
MLEYSVEGESITPEEFEAGEWTSVLKAQDRFKKSLYGDNAESTPRETQAGSDGRKALGAEQVKRGRAPVRQKRRPFLKMPAKDFKVVCRPKNWDLSVVTPRELGSAMRAAAKLTSATAAEEDLVRVNETNNTMTWAYASVKTLKLGGRDLPVSAYVAAMENSVRGVIYNAYDGCPVEEIRAGFLKKNEGMEILDARPLGKSKAIQITFGGKPRKQPPGRQQSSEDKSQDGKEEQRSRPTERSSSGARDGNKSRDRSGSFPPLPGAGAGKAGGQGSSHERSANSANDTTKKVSWPNTGAPNETARERELKRQAPQKVAQAAGSRVQESSAMEVENRGPVKRPPPADEGTNAKRVAETSTADTPQPAFKVTSFKADRSRKSAAILDGANKEIPRPALQFLLPEGTCQARLRAPAAALV